jgi:hypothetical protein
LCAELELKHAIAGGTGVAAVGALSRQRSPV